MDDGILYDDDVWEVPRDDGTLHKLDGGKAMRLDARTRKVKGAAAPGADTATTTIGTAGPVGRMHREPLDRMTLLKRVCDQATAPSATQVATLLLLADAVMRSEPTAFLDLAHQIEVMELIGDLVKERGKTVVAILHDLNQAARHADHMVMLNAGKVAAVGRPEAVMTAENILTVFGVRATIISDPVTGTPMCIPQQVQMYAREFLGINPVSIEI